MQDVSGANEVAVEFLQRRAEELRVEAEAAEQRLQAYQKKHHLLSLDNNTNIIQDRLLSVNNALQAARLERISVEELNNQVREFQSSNRNLLEIAAIAGHGAVPNLPGQLNTLRQSQSVLGERYFERHPRMIEIANQIEIVEVQLEKAVALAVADLRTRLDKALSNEAALEREYKANEQDQIRL